MIKLLFVVFLTLQPIDAPDFTWAAHQIGKDTVVIVSFPSEGINERSVSTCMM